MKLVWFLLRLSSQLFLFLRQLFSSLQTFYFYSGENKNCVTATNSLMLAKRKFQSFVNTYSDQNIGGKKTFTENLVVIGECTLPDNTNLNITFDNSSIPESAIVSTTGWIYDTFTELIGSVSDLVND